ncbi:sodium-dependent transporter [Clostridium rectalis]|uniref:sodium-dependent transporter n=1 Tax=Clostridium rectalis TaxID=2040295 RepID=UPI000F62D92F|nr:sodium-dependent transporter [Clostridium rectalis]
MVEKRESFSGKLGFVLSCLGSAIGLGNIWMFPWKLGEYGGAAFLIPFFICVFLLGATGLVGEFAFGRMRKSGSLQGIKYVFEKRGLKGGKIFSLIPTLAVAGTLIFYAVVVGWVFRYFFSSFSGAIYNVDIENYFNTFAGTKSSIIWHFIALFFTLLIVTLGVTNGIEKINKIMMPALFIIFSILLIRTLTLPGAREGLKYLLVPKWEYLLKPETWIMALGQAFFSVSLNGAGMVVYGSYLKDDIDIPKAAIQVAIFDVISALLAAFMIIPAVFAFGLNPSAGPSLLFITMPHVFKAMPFGYIFGILFFLSIIFAAISSIINMLEATSEAYMGKFKVSRFRACLIIAIIAFVIAIPLDLSMVRFGAFADFITIYLAPLGSIIAAITFFWIYGIDKAKKEISKGMNHPIGKWFEPLAKYVFVISGILVLILGIVYNGIG